MSRRFLAKCVTRSLHPKPTFGLLSPIHARPLVSQSSLGLCLALTVALVCISFSDDHPSSTSFEIESARMEWPSALLSAASVHTQIALRCDAKNKV